MQTNPALDGMTLDDMEDAIEYHGSGRSAAEALGIPEATFRTRLKRLRNANAATPTPQEQEYPKGKYPAAPEDMPEIDEDADIEDLCWEGDEENLRCSFYAPNTESIQTPEELIERTGLKYDETKWRIKSFNVETRNHKAKIRSNQASEDPTRPDWQMTYEVTQLYHVRVQFERLPADNMWAMKQELLDELKQFTPEWPALEMSPNSHSRMGGKKTIEISLYDAHIGKYCWDEETGENYDISRALKIVRWAMETMISKVRGLYEDDEINRFIFVVGNDLMHIDNEENTTTRGTRQDVDTRYRKVKKVTRNLMIECIGKMAQVAPVSVIVVPGNHDNASIIDLGDTLELYYNDCERVDVINKGIGGRRYFAQDNILLGYTHGEKSHELKNLPLLMATEMPEAWAKAKHREFKVGHLHTRKATKHSVKSQVVSENTQFENVGVLVRTMPSVAGNDAWHAGEGFVGNTKMATAICWDHEYGCEAELPVTIPREFYD